MALVFPNIQLDEVLKGSKFVFKAAVVVASNADVNWTSQAVATWSAPTLTITSLTSSGGSIARIDGINTLAVGNRILIKDGASLFSVTPASTGASLNGIWEVTGGTGTSVTLIRPFDFQEGDAAINSNVWVNSGTTWGNTGFVCVTNATVQTGVSPAGNLTFTQYDVRATLAVARGGTGVTTFGGTNTLLFTTAANTLSQITTANDGVLITSASGVPSISSTLPVVVQNNIDHNELENLAVGDFHTQYALLAGRASAQTLIGGTGANANLTLESTSNVTKGFVVSSDPFKVSSVDTLAAGALSIGTSTANALTLAKNGVVTTVAGNLAVQSVIDASSGVALAIGGTTATGVNISRSSQNTSVLGPLKVAAGAGFGVDVAAAGFLKLGEVTATRVDISSSSVTTDVKGPFLVKDSIDSTSAITIGATTATGITLARNAVNTTVAGGLRVQSNIDTSVNTQPIVFGGTNANKVDISRSGITTEIKGALTVASSINRATAGILTIGDTTTTQVALGAANVPTRVLGNLIVDGTTTTVNSEQVNVADNYFYMNADYTAVSGQTGGLVVNYLPTAVNATVATGGFTSTTTVAITGTSGVFAVNDFVQINNANNQTNNGVFEISAVTASVLTIKSSPTQQFSQNTFVVDATVSGSIRKVTLSALRVSDTTGNWQVAKGSSSAAFPYTDLALSGRTWSFQVVSVQVSANSTGYTTVAYLPWDVSAYNATTAILTAWVDVGADRNLDIQVWDGSASIGTLSVVAATAAGIATASLTVPSTDKRLEIRVRKSGAGGVNPQIYGINIDAST